MAVLAGAFLVAGCDEKAPEPGPRFKAAEKAYVDAQQFERIRSLDKAAKFYRSALAHADLLIKDLVPGDELLEQTQKLREDAATGIARVKQQTRREEAAAGAKPEKRRDDRFPAKNLLPPVLAYVPPAKETEKTDPAKKDPADPGKDPAGPKTEPGKQPEPVKKEPEKPKTVRVTRVVLKEDGKTILIYWTFTNLEAKIVRIGAPMGYLHNRTGGQLTSFRQHFLARNFAFNAGDPLSSRGTAVTPDTVQVGKGGSHELITIGVVTTPSVCKQAGGAKIVVRMGDGSEPADTFSGIVREQHMRAAVIEKAGNIAVRDIPPPVPAPGEVLLRVSCVSICGSDHHAYLGEFGARVRFPAVLGHEFCGTVEQLGEGVSQPAVGERVVIDPVIHCGVCPACREGKLSSCRDLKLLGIDLAGGFGELVAAPAHTVFTMPEELSDRLGPMVELTSIACHAAARSRYAPGESVVVFGAGKLGLTVLALLARCSPSRLVAVDLDPTRLELAKNLGATDVINIRDADPIESVLQLTGGDGMDLAFEAVGSYQEVADRRPPVSAATEAIRSGGRVLVLGQGTGEQPVAWKPFVWKEAEIITSRVSRGEFPRAISLVASGRMPAGKLITHEMSIAEAPEAFRLLDECTSGVVKILLHHTR